MPLSHTPADLIHAGFSFTDPNLDKVRADGRKDLAISTIKLGRTPARVYLRGFLTTDGINKSEHELYGDKYSFGMQLDSEEDVRALNELVNALRRQLAYWETDGNAQAYAVKDLFRNEVLYLKAKTNTAQSAFTFESNYKLHPKKPNADITRWMPIDVEADLGAWINVVQQTAGVYFTLRKITFREHEEDAVDVGDVEPVVERKSATPAPAAVPGGGGGGAHPRPRGAVRRSGH